RSHVALVGENGAGKSTLIKLLLGMYVPSSGTVRINGQNLNTYDVNSWHKQLAVLLQEFIHYSYTTIGENIWHGDVRQKYDPETLKAALAQGEATEIVDALPHKLETQASNWFDETEGIELSGGQWQRIALSRNFFRQAPIIILDEPTSAIDALAEAKIFRKLFARDNKKTVITISHRRSTVEKADIIYVLKDGRIAESGTHKELVAKNGEYCRMFADQLR
ncbi:MAG TPA: ABC transporter ATP-binding protein, partial [Candidatus Saccharimonadales bacterium]|nr:ABC transporter ATP-binding protein [Candidatus Saccharimonadales bacterium]